LEEIRRQSSDAGGPTKKGPTALQFAHMRISVWNIAAVTLMAVIGILVLKVLFSRVNVPGLSDAVRAV
jgi:hypothetical protein